MMAFTSLQKKLESVDKTIFESARKLGAAACLAELPEVIDISVYPFPETETSKARLYISPGQDHWIFLDVLRPEPEYDHISFATTNTPPIREQIDQFIDLLLSRGKCISSVLLGSGGREPSIEALSRWVEKHGECAPELKEMIFTEDEYHGWVVGGDNILYQVPIPTRGADRVEHGRSHTGYNPRDAWQSREGTVYMWYMTPNEIAEMPEQA